MNAKKLRLLVKGATLLAWKEGNGSLTGDLSVAVPLLAKALEKENPLNLQTVLAQIAEEEKKQM